MGAWQIATPRGSTDISPAQTVALRFSEDADFTATTDAGAKSHLVLATATAKPMVLGSDEFALLNPDPMMPPPQDQQAPLPTAADSSATETAAPHPKTAALPKPPAPTRLASAASMLPPVHAERPGFMLNDAQIASIKRRLHLTPDQERMWPAVEAALRNIAYANARDARRRGISPGSSDVASIDPNGAEVANLKSAAIPLIMSFDDEQRNEVRSLAHVMGLDRLASEL
jgi:hypothetical protein